VWAQRKEENGRMEQLEIVFRNLFCSSAVAGMMKLKGGVGWAR
jgi:hypothetical protein